MSAQTDGRIPTAGMVEKISDQKNDDPGRLTAALAEITSHRAVIEQAKGMLMFIFGVDADAAFEMLRKHSQHQNVKLRALAEQVATDLVDLSQLPTPVRRLKANGILASAHLRIAAASRLDGTPTPRG